MTLSRKALLVGSSFSAVPIFFALKARGLHVSVCGNLQSDPCHQYADASFFVDYSDRDALLKVVQDNGFDFLVPSCNDYAYMASTWVAAQCGFPGYDSMDAASIIHTKGLFRRFTETHSIKAPHAVRLSDGDPVEAGTLRAPYLVKPVDSFSGRGVTRVRKPEALADAVATARSSSRSPEVVVEEFIEGSLHSHSAFFSGGKIVSDFFVDEYCTVYPYQVNCSNHPSRLDESPREAVREEMRKVVRLAGLSDGLMHTQFIEREGRVWIIESMRRCPGDLYNKLVEYSTGAPYTDYYVRPFVGEPLPAPAESPALKYVGRHTISTAMPTVAFSFSHNLPTAAVRTVPLKNSGERLGPAPYDKLAIVFAEFATREELLAVAPDFARYISIQSPE